MTIAVDFDVNNQTKQTIEWVKKVAIFMKVPTLGTSQSVTMETVAQFWKTKQDLLLKLYHYLNVTFLPKSLNMHGQNILVVTENGS